MLNKVRKMLFKSSFNNIGSILMLHRVAPIDKNRLWYNEHLKVSPVFLDNFISTLKKGGFTFVSIDEITDEIQKGNPNISKLISVTLDDGYKDNYLNGLEIFKTHNIPFCIYVSTGMIEKQVPYWWYVLEDAILSNDTIALSNGSSFCCITHQEKEKAFLGIREVILTLPQRDLSSEMTKLFKDYRLELHSYSEELPLTWEQIKLLNDEPLASIGCHTHSHFSFIGSTDNEIIDDIELSKHLLKKKGGVDSHHFCFPFGDNSAITKNHIKLVSDMNFKTSVTTYEANCTAKANLMALPRFFLSEKNSNEVILKISKTRSKY